MALPATEISENSARPRRRIWPALLGVAVLVPVCLTLAGALTSPPHVAGPPVGKIVFLDADEPSIRTTMLRGLVILTPDGRQRQILHEIEGQDTEDPREWITQPAASPDGTQIAFLKQIYTLKEEDRSVVNQLWVIPTSGGKPKMLLDLTKNKLKQIVGLAWTHDGKNVVFLNDASVYEVGASDGKVMQTPLENAPPLTTNAPNISATRNPFVAQNGRVTFGGEARTKEGETASSSGKTISVTDASGTKNYDVTWGWSAFGGRKITSLKWSPDGKYLGFTVSKPPVPEDELFYLDLATGKTYQMPVRTGRAAWDWSR